jgi:DNA-binding transcriptional LysR family regulator
MIDVDRLEAMGVLLSVIDAGSLSAAGRKLGMPLATVSRKVSDLEAELKTRLLIRSTRRLTLTEAGRGYVSACRRILEDVNEAERAAAGEYSAPRGELVVTAPVVFGRLHLLPVLNEFLQAYPEVTVRLALGDRIVNLLEDHVDLALRIGPLPDSGLIGTHLGSIRRVVCASPVYLAKSGVPAAPRDLAGHECISFELFATANSWRFTVDRADISVPVRARLIVSTAEAAIDAAIAGLGITCVLSYQIESALRAGALRLLLESFEPPPLPVSFLYSSQGRLPLKLRALLDFAAPRLRIRLQQAQATLESFQPTGSTSRRARQSVRATRAMTSRPAKR